MIQNDDHYRPFLKLNNRLNIVERLGSRITSLINIIILCHYFEIGVDIDDDYLKYKDRSIFMKTLIQYVKFHNNKYIMSKYIDLCECIQIIPNRNIHQDWQISQCLTNIIKCDLLTYYRTNILQKVLEIFNNNVNILDDKSKINDNELYIHLRLGDVNDFQDYDSNIFLEFYNNHYIQKNNSFDMHKQFLKYLINNNIIKNKYDYNKFNPVCSKNDRYMYQSPISQEKIVKICDEHFEKFEKIIVCEPNSNIENYDKITYSKVISNNVDEDLYTLIKSNNLILSRSCFSYSSLFFKENIGNVWVPNWGLTITMGLNTKYDKCKLNYF